MSVQQFDLRPRWRREVLRSARLSAVTKTVLWVLAEHMRDDCKVSVSRTTVAAELGWGSGHVRRVAWNLSAARSAGYLVTVTEGAYGRTATWQGVLPDRSTDLETRTVDETLRVRPGRTLTDDLADELRVRKTSTLTVTTRSHPYEALRVRPGRTPLLEADPGPRPQTDQQLRAEPSDNRTPLVVVPELPQPVRHVRTETTTAPTSTTARAREVAA